jgi:adenine-specific DNA-methyltransferase
MDISLLEKSRLQLQQERDLQRTSAERNRLGQFATPFPLAREIVAVAVALLPAETPQVRFLDPAFGTGAFYSAVQDVCNYKMSSARGFEIDPHYGVPASRLWSGTGLHLELTDFTLTTPAEPCINLLVCNPPYVRHHHLSAEDKQRLRAATGQMDLKPSGLAGLYCYFMLLAHRWLLPGAVSAWLVPSEFMDVNYGDAIKEYLLDHVTLLRIHRFAPSDVQFADALVSSAVVLFRNLRPHEEDTVEMSYGGTLTTPAEAIQATRAELRGEPKWTRLSRAKRPQDQGLAGPEGVRVGDLFWIKRGLATGDNGFFILPEGKIHELGFTGKFLRPILPSPRYLPADEIAADEHGMPLLERRLFLIDCHLGEDELRAIDPALARYLEAGKDSAGQGYLCRSRTPWYSQEERPPAPLLCTYMGRSTDQGYRPFRFILNWSSATAANVYLLLYPKPAIRDLMTDPEVVRRVFQMLNSIPMGQMTSEGRVYGGGLHKLEPRELANVRADEIASLVTYSNGLTRGVQIELPQV